jgi:hypothetical protein
MNLRGGTCLSHSSEEVLQCQRVLKLVLTSRSLILSLSVDKCLFFLKERVLFNLHDFGIMSCYIPRPLCLTEMETCSFLVMLLVRVYFPCLLPNHSSSYCQGLMNSLPNRPCLLGPHVSPMASLVYSLYVFSKSQFFPANADYCR